MLANKLLEDSYTFLSDLFTYMTAEVNDMNKQKGEETEHDNWRFISHVVREIFTEIHKIRQYGVGSEPVEQIWYAMQAWKLQQRIRDNSFTKDPIVEAVFNQYIKDYVVSKTIFDKEMDQIKAEMASVKDLVQKANAKVQSIASQRGKNKGNGEG